MHHFAYRHGVLHAEAVNLVDLAGTVTDLTEPDGLVASHAPLRDGRIAYVVDIERETVIGRASCRERVCSVV